MERKEASVTPDLRLMLKESRMFGSRINIYGKYKHFHQRHGMNLISLQHMLTLICLLLFVCVMGLTPSKP